MRMSLRAVSLADITTLNGEAISHNAWLLESSNGLRDGYESPTFPPSFTKKQLGYWQIALQSVFVISHPTHNERKLKPSLQLGIWTESSIIRQWNTFCSSEEDRIYKRAGLFS